MADNEESPQDEVIETDKSPLVGKPKAEKPEIPKAPTSEAVEQLFDKLENGTLKIGSEIEFARHIKIQPSERVKTFGKTTSEGVIATYECKGFFCGIHRDKIDQNGRRDPRGNVYILLSKTAPFAVERGNYTSESVPILELDEKGNDITTEWTMGIL